MRKNLISAILMLSLMAVPAFAKKTDKKSVKEPEAIECSLPDCAMKQKKERVFPSEALVKKLNLSDKQVADMKAADQQYIDDRKAAAVAEKEAIKAARANKEKSLQSAKQKRNEAFRATLSTEQYIQYLEYRIESMEKKQVKQAKERREEMRKHQPMKKEHRPNQPRK